MFTVVARHMSGSLVFRDHRVHGSYVRLEWDQFEPSGGGGVLGLPDYAAFFRTSLPVPLHFGH